jgi:putative heme transporter
MVRPQQDSSPNPLSPEATGAPPSGQSILFKVLSAAFSGGLLVLIAVWFRNEIDEYGDSLYDAIAGLTVWQAVLGIVAGLVIMTLNGMAMQTPLNGISTVQAFVAQQSSSAISNVIPGPSGTAARFAILHSWKVSVEDFTRGTVAVSIWNNVLMISMPGFAFLVLALTGDSSTSGERLVLLAAILLAVSVLALFIVAGALRSEKFARWLGRLTAAIVNPARRLIRKPPIEDLDEACAQLRSRTVDVLSERKARLTTITLSAYWLNGLLLVACMWIAGVPHAELALLVGLALYSVGRLATMIQITPGGVGVVEVVYSAVFMTVVPEQYNAQVVTGVLLYRLLTYVLPILVGGATYVVWRRMRAHELAGQTTDA